MYGSTKLRDPLRSKTSHVALLLLGRTFGALRASCCLGHVDGLGLLQAVSHDAGSGWTLAARTVGCEFGRR